MCNEPDIQAAKYYALRKLEDEIPPSFCYHNIVHTRDGVISAAEALADATDLATVDRRMLLTAAAFHDLGFVHGRVGHEESSVRIAMEVLPRFHYSTEEIDIIAELILVTRMPQSPRDRLQSLLADADLDVLGRANFIERNRLLRRELEHFGEYYSDHEWYVRQLAFMEEHRYFTEAARNLRDPGKRRNIREIKHLIRIHAERRFS